MDANKAGIGAPEDEGAPTSAPVPSGPAFAERPPRQRDGNDPAAIEDRRLVDSEGEILQPRPNHRPLMRDQHVPPAHDRRERAEGDDVRIEHGLRGLDVPEIDQAFPAAQPVTHHLVLVHRPGWQSVDDWHLIAGHVREVAPEIGVFIVTANMPNSFSRRAAARCPSLIVSPSPMGAFRPSRGAVFHGRQIPKMEQLRLLARAGVRVPRTEILTPDRVLDATWDSHVIVKPTDIGTASYGQGIQLVRRARVRYIAPSDYPEGHPGRRGPMMVQQFIDTGEHFNFFRVMTLFGEPLYCQTSHAKAPRPPLDAADAVLETAPIAIQATDKVKGLPTDVPDVLALARVVHNAIPDVPLKGTDILRCVRSGRLYVLEVNPTGNTWHFSSDHLAKARQENGPEFEAARLAQFDAFRTAARVLAEKTRELAV